MKLKKLTVIFLLVVLLVSQFTFVSFNNISYANENVGKFHYDQLNSDAKVIYDALYSMYVQGILKTGTQDYDLVEHGLLTQDQVKGYVNGSTKISSAMNAARYAFYADHPEIFYVNSQQITIRATKDAQNQYHAYLGSGRYANYYTPGFNNQEEVEVAIREFDERVNEIVEKANNVENTENKIVEQIKLVHNEIINTTGYRLESDCTPGNEGFVGTPYGALVKKQAVCEGYSRAFKTILDKLGINCILVQGIHQYEGEPAEPHMWNYVQVPSNARTAEGNWYAVDCTMDDPFERYIIVDEDPDRLPGSNIVEGFENTRFCLVGTETMNRNHTPLETVEAAGNYTFKYPELSVEDHGIGNTITVDGLTVKYKQEGTEIEDYQAGDYYVSYNNKGYVESAKDGNYIIMRAYSYEPGDEEWRIGAWGYLLPDVYVGGYLDYEDHIYIILPNAEYVEFAVTTMAPGNYKEDFTYLAYQGDESDFVARTQKLYNPSGTYKGQPYIKTQSPEAGADLRVGPTYHVDVTYDDDLVFAEGATEVGYRFESTGHSGVANSEITNFAFDGKNRITFDIKFSQMYADDGAIYITGLVGKNSGKEPKEITYGARNYILCSNRMNASKNWEVFGRPTLIENEDLSMNGWETSDGEPVSDKLKSRIALVTTRTTEAEEKDMNNLMENQLGNQELITSETYNISLNVCKKYVVKTGHRLRIALGFPEGYGPEDAGVTFKAYHFMRDNAGNVTGVEEIPCVVTQYGLVITCDSFSPFAIAVVEKDETQEPENKAVIVSAADGGRIEGASRDEGNIVTLAQNESRTLNIVPDEGYEIDTITVCGKKQEVTNKDAMEIAVNYDDVKDGENMVYVTFIAKQVVEKEEERHESVVEPIVSGAPAPKFTTSIVKSEDTEIHPGDEFTVDVNISDIKNIEKGLIIIGGQLEFDKNSLELLNISGQNDWSLASGFNEKNLKFVTDNEEYISNDSTIFTMRFKASEEIQENITANISVKNITASNAINDIISEDATLQVEINGRPDSFSTETYVIDNEYITRIPAGTTLAMFKANVEAYPGVVVKDINGRKIADTELIATGMTLEVGETIKYTLVVTGDLNGNGEISVTDLGKLKLHYIEKEILTGAYLKAADMNSDNEISITDLAQIKAVLIGK